MRNPLSFKFKKGPDVITVYLWALIQRLVGVYQGKPFHSQLLNFDFSNFSDYHYMLGKKDALVDVLLSNQNGGIKGYSFPEVIARLARMELGTSCGVILFNINYFELGRISDRFPGANLSLFKEDFVVIPAKSKEHALKILNKIPASLASSMAVQDGYIFETNEENLE